MNNNEFSLRESTLRVFSRWWVVVILMVSGGVAGWIFHLFRSPMYDANATITINMEYQKRELTELQVDSAFNAASAIITSSTVFNQVITEAQAQGYSINLSFIHKYFFLEGRQSVWELRVRDENPNNAAALANVWANKATDALTSALGHALQADQLQIQISGLENCLAGMTGQMTPTPENCNNFSQSKIQEMLQNRAGNLIKEKKSSLGILPIMTISLTDLASAPEKPAIFNQGNLVFGGAIIALVVSLWAVNTIGVSRHVGTD